MESGESRGGDGDYSPSGGLPLQKIFGRAGLLGGLIVLSISKALSVAATEDYYDEQYSNGRENYYTEGDKVTGAYFSGLAEEIGLSGDVSREEFQRLIRGQDPLTGGQIIKHVPSKTYDNKFGKQITTATHRAGWDL